MYFNQIDEKRRTAIYVRISTAMQKTDRPNFSILMAKLEMGEYTQVLFSEFSRLERKPTNLLHDLEKYEFPGAPGAVSALRRPILSANPGTDHPELVSNGSLFLIYSNTGFARDPKIRLRGKTMCLQEITGCSHE